jgi:hypothetical protein
MSFISVHSKGSEIHLPGTAGTGRLSPAQLAGNEVVYSGVLIKAGNALSHEDLESHFKGELSKKQYHSFCKTIPAAADSNGATTRQA